MAESFAEKRRRELGVGGGTSTPTSTDNPSYAEKRRMDLGIIPDTRPRQIIQPPSDAILEQEKIQAIRQDPSLAPASSMPTDIQYEPESRPGRDLPVIGKVLQGLDYVGQKVEPVANVARSLYTPGAGLGNVAGAYGAVGSAIERLAPGLGRTLGGRVAQEAIKETVVGAQLGAGQALTNQTTDLGEVAKQGAIGGAIGGVTGGAGPLIGTAFRNSKIGQAFSDYLSTGKPVSEPQASPILALPEPRQRGNFNSAQTPDVIYGEGNIYSPEPLGLPQPDIAPPTRARVGTRTNPYEVKLNRLFEAARQQDLPPGREREALEGIWASMADRNDPGLDELIDLAYPSGRPLREVNPDALRQAREHQAARDVAGVPSPVQSMGDRYRGGVSAPVEPPIERVGRSPNSPKPVAPSPTQAKPQPKTNRDIIDIKATPVTGSKPQPTMFTTAKGSTYTVDSEGRTTRNKSLHEGHETKDVGQKPISERTVYVSADDATRVGQHGSLNKDARSRVVIRDDGLYLVSWNSKENRWGKHGEKISYTTNPEVGRSPIEFWNVTDEQGLGKVPKKFHAGNQITEMRTAASKDAAQQADEQIVEEFTTPRVRDKLSSYADELINSAKSDLKGNKLSSNPLDTYAKFGAGYILKGAVKLADFTEIMVKEFGEGIRPMVREIWTKAKGQYTTIKADIERKDVGLHGIDLSQLKDHSGFKYNSTDIYRNFRDVFGESFPQVKAAVLDPLDEAKATNVKLQHDYLQDLYTNVVQKLGITKGSKLSAMVQDFGEGKISLDDLKAKTADWEKVVEADKWFRRSYDTLLDEVNQTRSIIYPNNPDKIVPKRSDYYRHFQELNGLEGLKNIFETPSNIDPKLEGISEFLTPKSKFAGFMQRRGLGPYKKDAVGGFLNYLPSASFAIHIDPHINTFKTMAKVLAEDTTESKNLNKFINFLNRYSQDLAGKTNVLDRAFVEYVPGGRTTMAAMNWLNNRIKANVILGNVGSTVAQIANIPQGIAFAKQYAVPGAGKTLQSIFKPNEEIKQSGFITERFADRMYRKFDTNWLSLSNPLHLRKMAEWMLETGDRMGTEFIWNSVYYKGIKEGVKDPVKYADGETRRLVGGRGIGEVPLMQKSKLVQMVMPFTLEVANLWKVQRDFIKAKDFVGIAMLFVGNYALNKVSEQVRGSGVTFDPIQAAVEASAADLSIPQRVGRLGGEVLSNLPLGQTLAKAYPEYGKDVFGYQLPTRKALFGDNDPTRFGGGLLAVKGVQEPLTYLAPSFGGNQIKKTVNGVQTLLSGGDTTGKGELKYPVDRSPGDLIKAPLFGPSATSEARDYYKNERRPLSEKQTEAYKQSPNPREFYKQIMQNRKLDAYQKKISDIAKDSKLTDAEKEKQVNKVLEQYTKDFPTSP